jgi:hypothetical protein
VISQIFWFLLRLRFDGTFNGARCWTPAQLSLPLNISTGIKNCLLAM